MVKTAVIFLGLLLVGSSLIYFGSRNDAVSVAKSIKSGGLTADEINIAFENVGGKLISRKVQESQQVKKGDVLMVLDEVDTDIAIERLKAVIRSQEALIRQEESAIHIATNETTLTEVSSWRKIEEIQATLSAVRASENLARTDFNRIAKLHNTGSVSQSMLDNANSSLTTTHAAVIQAERQLASAMIGTTPAQMKNLSEKESAQGMTLQSIANSRESIKNRQNILDQLLAQLDQSHAELRQLEVNRQRLIRFEGNYFAYLPTIFMTGLAFGWLALILSWSTQNPGEGASLMTFLVPPGFILGGATMAVGFLPLWAYYISYAFPLVWQYRFYRDFAMRGQTLAQMLPTYGAYLIFLTVIASVVVLLYYRTKRQVAAG